jgi:hypothetical protein
MTENETLTVVNGMPGIEEQIYEANFGGLRLDPFWIKTKEIKELRDFDHKNLGQSKAKS